MSSEAESLSNCPQVNSPVELKVRADPLFSVYYIEVFLLAQAEFSVRQQLYNQVDLVGLQND